MAAQKQYAVEVFFSSGSASSWTVEAEDINDCLEKVVAAVLTRSQRTPKDDVCEVRITRLV